MCELVGASLELLDQGAAWVPVTPLGASSSSQACALSGMAGLQALPSEPGLSSVQPAAGSCSITQSVVVS